MRNNPKRRKAKRDAVIEDLDEVYYHMTHTTKKKKLKPSGELTSIQFDNNGLPIYVFTNKGIYHVEFKEMEKDDDN